MTCVHKLPKAMEQATCTVSESVPTAIPRGNGPDVFVHHTAIMAEGFRSLNEGDRVSFEVVNGQKGLQARNVVRI